MKLIYSVFFTLAFLSCSGLYAQEDSTAPPAPVDVPAPAEAAAPVTTAAPNTAAAPAKAPAAPRPKATYYPQDTSIRGNAGRDVGLTDAQGTCANSLKPVGIINRAAAKQVVAVVEVTTVYNGHGSKKNIKIDNIAPHETRYIGCTGCIDNQTGKTCTSYKILAAIYK